MLATLALSTGSCTLTQACWTQVDVPDNVDVDSVKSAIVESLGLREIHHARLVMNRMNNISLDPFRSLREQGVIEGERCWLELLPPVDVGAIPAETVLGKQSILTNPDLTPFLSTASGRISVANTACDFARQ